MDKPFNGFTVKGGNFSKIPSSLFSEILFHIDDLAVLKLCLYVLWKADTIGDYGMAIDAKNVMLDTTLTKNLNETGSVDKTYITALLEKCADAGILIRGKRDIYFINCEAGQESAASNSPARRSFITLDQFKPNIYQLYQENIGALTPLISDALKTMENDFPASWIEEAIEIAVKRNARNLRYIESILDRWQKEGRDGRDRKNDQSDYRKYLKE